MPALLRLVAAALALALLAAACGDDTGSTTPRIDLDDGLTPPIEDVQPEPSRDNIFGLEFVTFDGDPASFETHLGTPLIINFFAEWCPSCITEMPDFETVSQQLAGEVDFVGISIDQASEDAIQLVAETGVTYEVGWDPSEELLTHFRSLAMPTTVFVEADGAISRVWSGALDADALTELINEEIL